MSHMLIEQCFSAYILIRIFHQDECILSSWLGHRLPLVFFNNVDILLMPLGINGHTLAINLIY